MMLGKIGLAFFYDILVTPDVLDKSRFFLYSRGAFRQFISDYFHQEARLEQRRSVSLPILIPQRTRNSVGSSKESRLFSARLNTAGTRVDEDVRVTCF